MKDLKAEIEKIIREKVQAIGPYNAGIEEAAAAIAALYEARLAETEQALRHLRNEAHGVVHTWRYELAELAGETNVACLLRRIQEADKALAAGEGEDREARNEGED